MNPWHVAMARHQTQRTPVSGSGGLCALILRQAVHDSAWAHVAMSPSMEIPLPMTLEVRDADRGSGDGSEDARGSRGGDSKGGGGEEMNATAAVRWVSSSPWTVVSQYV